MNFAEIKPDDCMHQVSMDLAKEFRHMLHAQYCGMYRRNEEIAGVMPNVVLAGLTLLWLESVHTVFGTAEYESALRLVGGIRPNDELVAAEMKQAVRDFLRRSRWLPAKKRTA